MWFLMFWFWKIISCLLILQDEIYNSCTNKSDPNGLLWCSTKVHNPSHLPLFCKGHQGPSSSFRINLRYITHSYLFHKVDSEGKHMRGNFGYCGPDCLEEEDDEEFDNEVSFLIHIQL